jgi:anti-anti-sigma regulatory factor
LIFLPGLKSGSEGEKGAGELVSAVGDRDVVVANVSRLRLLPSSFLGMLVALNQQLQAEGKRLKVCGLSPDAQESFQKTKLGEFLEVYEDEPAAVAAA